MNQHISANHLPFFIYAGNFHSSQRRYNINHMTFLLKAHLTPKHHPLKIFRPVHWIRQLKPLPELELRLNSKLEFLISIFIDSYIAHTPPKQSTQKEFRKIISLLPIKFNFIIITSSYRITTIDTNWNRKTRRTSSDFTKRRKQFVFITLDSCNVTTIF